VRTGNNCLSERFVKLQIFVVVVDVVGVGVVVVVVEVVVVVVFSLGIVVLANIFYRQLLPVSGRGDRQAVGPRETDPTPHQILLFGTNNSGCTAICFDLCFSISYCFAISFPPSQL
jgi:hypothetical protein